MEQNKFLTIAIVSAIVGGIIGGGVSYIMLNPSIKTLDESVNTMEKTIDEIAEKTDSLQTSLNDQITSLENEIQELETSSQVSESNILNQLYEETNKIKNEPKYHLVYTDYEDFINNDSISEYPEKITTDVFQIKGDYTKINYRFEVLNTYPGANAYVDVNLYDEIPKRQLIYNVFKSGDSDNEEYIGEISLILEPGDYSVEILDYTFRFGDLVILNYEVIVWDYY